MDSKIFPLETEPLSLRLFGTARLERQGVPLPRTSIRKGFWLLALLVLHRGQAVSRSVLAGTLWPDSAEHLALYNLRRVLSDLRRVLGPDQSRLTTPTPRTVQFELSGMEIDVLAFDAAVASSDVASLETAAGLYCGPLLEECDEDWVTSERDARARTLLQVLETLAEHSRKQRDYESEERLLRRLLSIDRYKESTLRALMCACAAQANYTAVAAAYRDFRSRLREELRLEPLPETTALYQNLLQARTSTVPHPLPAAAVRRPARFPDSLDRLIGRDREVREIDGLLETSRLITIKGPGGSGKTQLALAVARSAFDRFAGQVWFVSLAELSDAQRLPETVRDALQLSGEGSDPFAQIEHRLSGQKSLLILDNYEQLTKTGSRFVQLLLAAIPSLHCLVTSRHSLHVSGQTEYLIPPLSLPSENDAPAHPLDFSSVQLFVDRAASHRGRFELTPGNIDSVVAICRKLEGIPLAIELAAAWSTVLSPAQIASRLEQSFSFPVDPDAEMPERHRGLQQAFDGSYDLLDESERDLLRTLSVFTGGWTLEAAEAICGDPRTAAQLQTLALLKRLVDKSLVVFDEHPGNEDQPRYRLLEMTRQYASERLSGLDRERAERRHAEYFFHQALLREADALANESASTQERQMRPDRENYRAAFRWWQTVDADTCLRLTLALDCCRLWMIPASSWGDRIREMEAQPLPPASPLQARLYLFFASGAFYRRTTEPYLLAERACILSEQCGDEDIRARSHLFLGRLDQRAGRWELARARFDKGLVHAQNTGIPLRVVEAQAHLCRLARAENNTAEAQSRAEEMIRFGDANHNRASLRLGLEEMAALAEDRQDYPLARHYLERALATCPETEALSRTNILRAMGNYARISGEYAAARDYYRRSIVVCQESNDLAHEAWSYLGLSYCEQAQGNSGEAIDWLCQAAPLFESLGEELSLIFCLRDMALFSTEYPEHAAFCWIAHERLMRERSRLSEERRRQITDALPTLRSAISESVFGAIEKAATSLSVREVLRAAFLKPSPARQPATSLLLTGK